MNTEESVKVIKEYNKWRRGKGRKYSQPGFPFNPTDIGVALDHIVECMKIYVKLEKHFEKKQAQ